MKKIISILLSLTVLAFSCSCTKEDKLVLHDIAKTVTDEIYGEPDFYDVSVKVIDESEETVSDMFENPSESISNEVETEVITVPDESEIPSTDEFTLDIDGTYTTADDVSLYIYLYDDLPDNFITKSEARDLGWTGGGLEKYAPGKCIGGDYFGNREGLLPKEKGRTYTECDINTLGKSSRGAERIVFSNDGLIFYTDDHYESFVLLYDEEGKAA